MNQKGNNMNAANKALEILREKYQIHNVSAEVFSSLAQAIAFYAKGGFEPAKIAELVAEEYSEHLPS